MAQDVSAFIPEVWAREAQTIFDKRCVMRNLVSRKYEKDLSFGDTVHVQLPEKLTAGSYTKNQTLTATELNPTDSTLVVNQSKYIYVNVDRLDQKQSKINIIEQYATRAGVGMAEAIDTRLLSHYTDPIAGNVIGSTGAPEAMTASNVYTYFTEAARRLESQSVLDGELHVVIPPQVRKLINDSPEMRERGTSMADETIKNGYAGKFGGFNVHVSTNMAQVSSVWPIMFFHKEFIQYVEQAFIVEYEDNIPGTFKKGYKTLALYGSKVFNTEAGVTIYATT